MIFHKCTSWQDLGKFTQYKAQSIYEYYLYTKFWRSQNISNAQFSIFPLLLVMWFKEYFT